MKKNIYLISGYDEYGEIIYKIGISKNVKTRLNQIKTGNPFAEIVNIYVTENFTHSIESNLHRKFEDKRVKDDNSAGKEWFYLTPEDVAEFTNLCQYYYDMFDIVENNNTWMEDKGYSFK